MINKVGFKQSTVDLCVFYSGSVIYVFYTNESILAGLHLKETDDAIRDIQKVKPNITIEGDLQDFLRLNMEQINNLAIHISHPHLIDQVLIKIKIPENAKQKSTPASSSKLIPRHSYSTEFDNYFR